MDIDLGQVGVNPNILLLEDVCFKAKDVVQVGFRRVDYQMWKRDYQNSDFYADFGLADF